MKKLENFTPQSFFDACAQSLRDYGNVHGSRENRSWSWCNPYNPTERCAIAQFIDGNSSHEIQARVFKKVNTLNEYDKAKIMYIGSQISELFDESPNICNNSDFLEVVLQQIASEVGAKYSPSATTQVDKLVDKLMSNKPLVMEWLTLDHKLSKKSYEIAA